MVAGRCVPSLLPSLSLRGTLADSSPRPSHLAVPDPLLSQQLEPSIDALTTAALGHAASSSHFLSGATTLPSRGNSPAASPNPASAHVPPDYVAQLRTLFTSALPAEHFYLLRAIAFHLARLAAHEHVNKMSLNNLKLILSPTLRLSPGFLGALVGEREALFGGGNDGASLSFSVRICDARRADAAPSCLCRWSRTTSRRYLLGLHLGTVRRRRLDVVRLSFDEPLLRRRQVARHRRAAPLPLARPHLHFLPLNPTLADAPLVQQRLDPDLDALRLAAADAQRRPLCLGIDVARVVRRRTAAAARGVARPLFVLHGACAGAGAVSSSTRPPRRRRIRLCSLSSALVLSNSRTRLDVAGLLPSRRRRVVAQPRLDAAPLARPRVPHRARRPRRPARRAGARSRAHERAVSCFLGDDGGRSERCRDARA